MKTKLVPMLAGFLILFSFGSARNTYAGNVDFDGARTAKGFNEAANFDFTKGFGNFDNFSNTSANFDVAVKQNFDRSGNFDFANFCRNRFSNGNVNVFGDANRAGFASDWNFGNGNATVPNQQSGL